MTYYYFGLSLLTFVVFGYDKLQAIRQKQRIRENTLLFLSFIGGGFGALLAMALFRHKIRKWKFLICVPISVVLHIWIFTQFNIIYP